jgi:hypothetical protein
MADKYSNDYTKIGGEGNLDWTHIGDNLWLNQYMKGEMGNIANLYNIGQQMGALQLNIPEYDVQKSDKYTRMFQAAGRREGETAARGVQSAMATRGGGGVGSALALGSQARTSPTLQALQTGIGYDQAAYQQDLQDYLTRLGIEQTRYSTQMGALEAERSAVQNAIALKFNILNQIVGAKLGQLGASTQIETAKIGADAQVQAAIWGAAGQIGSSGIGVLGASGGGA